ncbi:cytochrome c [Candidatus Binatia bacterium]|nr:cytochrome c [Candidatus Binatia bacterium]
MTELHHSTLARRSRRSRAAAATARALLVTIAAAALTALPGPARGDDEGARLYETLCASCHGVKGAGDGPAAGALDPPPTDLTRSTLTVPELMRVIDGRRTVRAHGSATMPVWGRVFEQGMEGSGRQHRDALRQTQILAEYVQSLKK